MKGNYKLVNYFVFYYIHSCGSEDEQRRMVNAEKKLAKKCKLKEAKFGAKRMEATNALPKSAQSFPLDECGDAGVKA